MAMLWLSPRPGVELVFAVLTGTNVISNATLLVLSPHWEWTDKRIATAYNLLFGVLSMQYVGSVHSESICELLMPCGGHTLSDTGFAFMVTTVLSWLDNWARQ